MEEVIGCCVVGVVVCGEDEFELFGFGGLLVCCMWFCSFVRCDWYCFWVGWYVDVVLVVGCE